MGKARTNQWAAQHGLAVRPYDDPVREDWGRRPGDPPGGPHAPAAGDGAGHAQEPPGTGSVATAGLPGGPDQIANLYRLLVWAVPRLVLALAPHARIDVTPAAVVLDVEPEEVRKRTRGPNPRLPSRRGRARRIMIPLADLLAYMEGERREGGGP